MIDQRINTFVTLSKELNYSRTAELLSLTQPAVTQHIQSIENEFNIKLFNKNGRSLIITKEGELLLKYCLRLQSLNTTMHIAMEDMKKNLVHLDIGLTPTVSEYLVPEILKKINEDQKTTISIHIHPIKELYERLDTYEFDFLIGDEILGDTKDYVNSKIQDDQLVFIASPNSKLASMTDLNLEDLREAPLILRHTKSLTRNLLTSYLTLRGDNINNYNMVLEIESIPVIKDLVMIDYGISVLPYVVCKKEADEGKIKILDVKNFKIKRSTYIIYRKDADLKSIINGFVNKIRNDYHLD